MDNDKGHGLSVVKKGGVEYVSPLQDERYLVKLFPLPAHDDWEGCIRLMESFERRFQYTADGGRQVMRREDLDLFIERKRIAYGEKSGVDKEMEGAALSMALLERGVRRAKEHMEQRMRGVSAGAATLVALRSGSEDDLLDAMNTFAFVRRKRGQKDIDDVLNEMKGEPYNIFIGTLHGSSAGLEFFRRNRMLKAAQSMKCVDEVVQGVNGLAGSHKKLEEGGVTAMLHELGEAAKARLQLQRSDPEFAAVERRLLIARNALLEFTPPKEAGPKSAHLPADMVAKQAVSLTTMALLQEAADLIYDIAIVRVPRYGSSANLAARVEEHRPELSKVAKRTGS